MTGTVIPFPGAVCRPPATLNLSHLQPGRKAIVICEDDDCYFSISMAPAVTPFERSIVKRFATWAEARRYARDLIEDGRLYQFVIDGTDAAQIGGAA